MATNNRYIDAPPSSVWDVLADGWLYPVWVVGATRIRDVDDTWPAEGAEDPPLGGGVADDHWTTTRRWWRPDPVLLLRLRARLWPFGEASVTIRLTASGAGTEVTIEEDAVAGPGGSFPSRCAGCRSRSATSRPSSVSRSSRRDAARPTEPGRCDQRVHCVHLRRHRRRCRPQRPGRGEPSGRRRLVRAGARGAERRRGRRTPRPRAAPGLRPRHVQRLLPVGRCVRAPSSRSVSTSTASPGATRRRCSVTRCRTVSGRSSIATAR